MAEQQSQTPTFKLVLVGDGGTGKVCRPYLAELRYRRLSIPLRASQQPYGGPLESLQQR